MIYYPFGQILPEGIFGVIGKSGRNPYYKKILCDDNVYWL